MSKRPRWHFSPIGSGPEYVTEPSSAYFSDSPIPKLVREVIQNSLDAKDRAFDDPVTVKFSEIQVQRQRIDGAALAEHLKSCLARAHELGRPGPINAYRNALKTAGRARIRCLKIQDAGATGLVGPHWDALVRQEGAVNKADASAGGSYGIGKNAALNVSDLQTVFYSTRYIAGRKGRVDLLQGKATLMAHPAPKGAAGMLQHIGFYAAPDGEPITGRRAMPSCFELDEPGTGVFIMGFNPHSEGDSWVKDVAARRGGKLLLRHSPTASARGSRIKRQRKRLDQSRNARPQCELRGVAQSARRKRVLGRHPKSPQIGVRCIYGIADSDSAI